VPVLIDLFLDSYDKRQSEMILILLDVRTSLIVLGSPCPRRLLLLVVRDWHRHKSSPSPGQGRGSASPGWAPPVAGKASRLVVAGG